MGEMSRDDFTALELVVSLFQNVFNLLEVSEGYEFAYSVPISCLILEQVSGIVRFLPSPNISMKNRTVFTSSYYVFK